MADFAFGYFKPWFQIWMVLLFLPFFVKYLEVWTCFTWNNKRRMFLRLLSNHSVRKQKVKLLFIKTIRYSKNIKMSNYKPRLSVCLSVTYRRPNRWSDRPQTWHVQRGRSRGCYRLGFKCLGSRRATKETEKGGRVSFGKLEKESERISGTLRLWVQILRGATFLPERRFFIF